MDTKSSIKTNPHVNAEVLFNGVKPLESRATVLLLHGRGDSATNMLSLFRELQLNDIAAIAPEAVNNTWYPYSFLAVRAENQPFLDSALEELEIAKQLIENV